MNLEENLINDPWGTIYWCSRNDCDLEVIGKIIAKLLTSDNREMFKTGLEALKAVKSQLQIDKQIPIMRAILENLDPRQVLENTSGDKIVSAMNYDYREAMGLITLLETYPILGLKKYLPTRILETIAEAFKNIRDWLKLLELLRAIIYGPISVLPPIELNELVHKLDELSYKEEIVWFKADLLMALPEIYPPKYYEEYPQLIKLINKLLKDVV
ncbi:MAG: hypothetical protein J7L82_00725, partial [Staphylothermus sp.]|nr:hypothetical protein [Staphylothermus sp.]